MITRFDLAAVAPRVTVTATLKNLHRIAKRADAVRRASTPGYLKPVFDASGVLVGQNVGTVVRPNIVRVVGTFTGIETVEQFLARGGSITVGAPKTAKGALLVDTIKLNTKRGHNRTGQIAQRTVRPGTMSTSSVVSLAREERPYNGTAMKMYGPRG